MVKQQLFFLKKFSTSNGLYIYGLGPETSYGFPIPSSNKELILDIFVSYPGGGFFALICSTKENVNDINLINNVTNISSHYLPPNDQSFGIKDDENFFLRKIYIPSGFAGQYLYVIVQGVKNFLNIKGSGYYLE